MIKVVIVLLIITVIISGCIRQPDTNELKKKYHEFKIEIDEKKAEGYDVTEAEVFAREAKEAFDREDYRVANTYLNKAFESLEKSNRTIMSVEGIEIKKPVEELLVISAIPFQDITSDGIPRPTWGEVEKALPRLKEVGVNTIFIWAPYEHRMPKHGETIRAYTDKGEVKLRLGYAVHIKDYLKPDSERGSEEEFLHMVETAHSLGIKVIAQVQVSLSTPGDYIYENHPEWMLKNIYGEPAILWPWGITGGGFRIDKSNPELVNYVSEVIIPYWIKNWKIDGIYLDSPAMAYSDLYTKNLCDNVSYVQNAEPMTPVEGYHSPEPLVKAMEAKIEQLEKEEGKKLIFAAEGTPKTWRDMPDDLIVEAYKGNYNAYQTDPRVDRSLGGYFSWVMGYNFRGVLMNVHDGGAFSYSEDYIKYFEKERELDRKYTEIARFVNMWISLTHYSDLLEPENSGNYLTLLLTAPGKVVFIGAYQLPPQSDVFEKLFNYDSKVGEEWYTKLIKIKKEYNALQSNDIEDALISPNIKRVIAYNRWNENESVTVIVNANDEPVNSVIKTRFKGEEIMVYDLLSYEKFAGNPKELGIYMPAHGSRILILEPVQGV